MRLYPARGALSLLQLSLASSHVGESHMAGNCGQPLGANGCLLQQLGREGSPHYCACKEMSSANKRSELGNGFFLVDPQMLL